MIRARFRANIHDPRPVKLPVSGPYWVTGEGEDCAIIVAYAMDENEILEYWPEATNIESQKTGCIEFTDRFPCPDWWKPGP